MRLSADKLGAALKKSIAPVYIVATDEPLLQQETCDLIRQSLRAQGFAERELFHVDAKFDWEEILFSANSMSLFADQKILEIRMPNGKPGDKGAAALEAFAKQPPEGICMLLIVPWMDNRAIKAKWVQALEKVGVLVAIWQLEIGALPGWIEGRFRQAGLRPSKEAVSALMERVEGNLLAAVQEIELLKLMAPSPEIDVDLVVSGVGDSSRYNVFLLIDAAVGQDSVRTLQVIQGLKLEDLPVISMLPMLARELRTLLSISRAVGSGQRIDAAFKSQWVRDAHRPLIEKCIRAHKPAELQFLLSEISRLDKTIKGIGTEDHWDMLTDIMLRLAGKPVLKAQVL